MFLFFFIYKFLLILKTFKIRAVSTAYQLQLFYKNHLMQMRLVMIKKQWKIIEKLKKKYALKQFLRQQDFDKLNPILISLNYENNAKKFARSKNLVVGFNLETTFLGYLQKYFFKRKTKKFHKAKIERLIKKNKVLKEKQKNQLHFRLAQAQSLLCFGKSGSGKTQNLVLPTIFANALSPIQPNLLIISSSEKIAKASFTFLQNQGYQVKVLNFFNQYSSDSFSPLIFLQELI